MKQSQDSNPVDAAEGDSLTELTISASGKQSAAQMIRSAVAQRSDTQGTFEHNQDQLADLLTATILFKGWSFSLREERLNADEVAGPRGLLPALLWQVEKMHRVAYGGKSTGISYVPDANNSTIGAGVVLQQNGPKSPMALFAIEALQRIQEAFPSPDGAAMDSMVREFLDDHDEGLIPWVPGTDAQPSLPGIRQGAGA